MAEYAPHLVSIDEDEEICGWIEIRPLVLPMYAYVLDHAIIVEQNEMEKRKYFDNKKW